MRTRTRSLVLLATAALALAACGGGGDDGTDAADTTAATADTTAAAGGGTAAETTAPPTTTPPTTTLPTTTTIAAAELPPCKVDALASADGPVDITFWHAMTADNLTAIDQLVADYNASQDKVKVTAVAQGGYDDNFDKYRTASAGDRPDVIQLPEYYLQTMVDSGTAVPTQSCINADPSFAVDELVDRARTAYTLEGVQWTMPFNVSSPVLYYNTKVFEAAGLDPANPPVTLEEWQAAATAIVSSGAAKYGAAIDTGTNSGGGWFVEQWLAKSDLPYANNGNGRAARATEVAYATQEAADLLSVVQTMVADGSAYNVGENASASDNLLKLIDQSEPAGMTINSSAALGSALNALKGGIAPGFSDADLGIGPMPGPTEGGMPVGGATLWTVKDKGDERTAAAWDFIKYMSSAEVQSTWAAATGYVPVNSGAPDVEPLKSVYTSDPRFSVAYQQLTAGENTVNAAGPVLGPMRQVREATAEAVRATLGGADPLTELQKAAEKADALIEDYNRRVGR